MIEIDLILYIKIAMYISILYMVSLKGISYSELIGISPTYVQT